MIVVDASGRPFSVPGPQFRREAMAVVTQPTIVGTVRAGNTISVTPGTYSHELDRSMTFVLRQINGGAFVSSYSPPEEDDTRSYSLPSDSGGLELVVSESVFDEVGRKLVFSLPAVAVASASRTEPGIAEFNPADVRVDYMPDELQTGAPLVMVFEIINPEHPAHNTARQMRWHTAVPDLADSSLGNAAIKASGFDNVENPYFRKWLSRDANGAWATWLDRSAEDAVTYSIHFRWSPDAPATVTPSFSPWSPHQSTTTPAVETDSEPPVVRAGALPALFAPTNNEAMKAVRYLPNTEHQNPLGLLRSISNPDKIFLGQDNGGPEVSLDNGRTWKTIQNRGLRNPYFASLEIDPLNEDRIVYMAGTRFGNDPAGGMYLSTDGCRNFSQKLSIATVGEPRRWRHQVAYAPSSASTSLGYCTRWYAVNGDYASRFDNQTGVDGLWISNDGAQTWAFVHGVPAATYGRGITGCRVHPTNQNKLFVWGDGGLYLLTISGGPGTWATTREALSGSDGLPPGAFEGDFWISQDGQQMMIAAYGNGVWRRDTATGPWTRTLASGGADCLFVNPGHPNYAVVCDDGSNNYSRFTSNALAASPTWGTSTGDALPGTTGNYQRVVGNNEPGVSWDPRTPGRATAVANSKIKATDNGAKHWYPSGDYWARVHHKARNSPQFYDPNNPRRYVLGLMDQGVEVTEDGGLSFKNGNMKAELGGRVTCTGWALHPGGQIIIANYDDENGQFLARSPNFGVNWTQVRSNNVKRHVMGFDVGDPNYAYNWREVSTDTGLTWTALPMPSAAATITGVSMTPRDGVSVLYAAEITSTPSPIWVSFTRGRSWVEVTRPSWSLRDFRMDSNGRQISGSWTLFRIHPTNPLKFYTRSSNRNIREWTIDSNGGITGTRDFDILAGATPPENWDTTHFVVDPVNTDVMYARATPNDGGFDGFKFFRSVDAGVTWVNYTDSFGFISGNGIEVHGLTGVCYVASVKGQKCIRPPYAAPVDANGMVIPNTPDLIENYYTNWNHNQHISDATNIVAPAWTSEPTLAGTGEVGTTLALNVGTITGTPPPTVTQEWTADGVTIPGETGLTFTPTSAYLGKSVTATVKADNGVLATRSPAPVTIVSLGGLAQDPGTYTGTWTAAEIMASPQGRVGGTFDNTTIPDPFDLYLTTRQVEGAPTDLATVGYLVVPGASYERPSKPVGTLIKPRLWWLRKSDGTVFAAGSKPDFTIQGIAEPPSTEDIVRVSASSTAIMNALLAAPGGRVIEVAPGNISGTLSRSTSTSWSPSVTIRPQDRNNPPVFTQMAVNFSNISGVTFDGLVFNDSRRDADGYPSGKTVQANYCKRIRFVDCLFANTHEGLRMDNSTDCTVEYCEWTGCGMDAMRVYGFQRNLIIRRNVLWKTRINLARQGESNRHPDCIQFACNGQDGQSRDVLVERNYLEGLQLGANLHGIFTGNNAVRVGDQTFAAAGYTRFTIRNNFIRTTHALGVGIEAWIDGTVSGNLMRQVPNATSDTDIRNPRTYPLGTNYSGVTVSNNVHPIRNPPTIAGITQSGNVVSKTAIPTGWTDLRPGSNCGRYAAR